jgi:hypothetical protein
VSNEVTIPISIWNAQEGERRMPVRGFQVGRFAVVRVPESVRFVRTSDGRSRMIDPWVIAHVPSGGSLITVKSEVDAFVVADDVSRFALCDPICPTLDELLRYLPEDMLAWLDHCVDYEVMGYRQWRGETLGNTEHD